MLKVEVGGDAQSSEGTEPSHSHAPNDLNYQRGYEWRLMVEARKRNPDIILGALAWAWPGYIGQGTASPWTNVTLAAGYLVDWMKGARDTYNLTVVRSGKHWRYPRVALIHTLTSLSSAPRCLRVRTIWAPIGMKGREKRG